MSWADSQRSTRVSRPAGYTVGGFRREETVMTDGLNKRISARNQLRGTVEEIVLGTVTAKVSVRVGENLIESVITRQSVEEMGIKVGDTVRALIKSTEVMIMTE